MGSGKENNTELRRLNGAQLLVDPCRPSCLSRGLPSTTSNQTRAQSEQVSLGSSLAGHHSPLRAASPVSLLRPLSRQHLMDPACRCDLDSQVGNRQPASHWRWRTYSDHLVTIWSNCYPGCCNSPTMGYCTSSKVSDTCCMSRFKFWTRPSRAVVGSGGGPASRITTPPLPPRHGAPDSTAGVLFCVFAHHGLMFTVAGDNIHKLLRPNKYCAVTMTVSISFVDNVR